jgi:two-component system, response regulator PdtaR
MMQPHAVKEELFALPPDRPLDDGDATGAEEFRHQADDAGAVLIVEDDFLIAMQTENALTEAGFRVIGIATTAEEAVELAREQRPSIAVMDIRLAGRRDGIDAAEDLFRDFGVRCIFATAHDDHSTRQRAEPFAPLGWLAKPYTMMSLVALVREALSRLN